MLDKNKVEINIISNKELEIIFEDKIKSLGLLGYWVSKPHLVSYNNSGFNNRYYGFLVGIRNNSSLSMEELNAILYRNFNNPMIEKEGNNYFTAIIKMPTHPDFWEKIR